MWRSARTSRRAGAVKMMSRETGLANSLRMPACCLSVFPTGGLPDGVLTTCLWWADTGEILAGYGFRSQ